jgi:uncharacterized membrane protein YdjX (TVP38/TMEM64 family)
VTTESTSSARAGASYARLGAALVVAVGLAVAYKLGAFAQLSDPRGFAKTLAAMGPRGYVGFLVAYTLLQPFGVPGTVFVVAAPLIWPWPTAFALSMLGTMTASVVGFSFARFMARDWVAARIPERFAKYEDALARNAFRTVFVLRFIFWMPQLLHGFLGVSRVPFWTHFWGSLAGYLVPLFVVSYFTAELFDASGNMRSDVWIVMGGVLVAVLLLALAIRVVLRRRAATRDDDAPHNSRTTTGKNTNG